MANIYLTKDVYYNEENSCVYKNGCSIPMKGNNKKLLLYLLKADAPASAQELMEKLWDGHCNPDTPRQNITRLRKAINDTEFELIQERNGCYFIAKSQPFSPEVRLPKTLTKSFIMNTTSQEVLSRKNERAEITDYLKEPGNRAILLHGFGGIGKTSVARLVYSWVQEKYDCTGWVDYQSNLIDSLLSCLETGDYMDVSMDNAKPEDKWRHISKIFRNNSQKKLFIIDNVDTNAQNNQNPLVDMTLKEITAWKNTDVIITSRFSKLEPYNSYEITPLGNEGNCSNCRELFYHYNSTAAQNRENNASAVNRLVQLAGYNSLVIELLAKISECYYDDLDAYSKELKAKGFAFPEMSVETSHNKYRMDTATHQLMKLFDPNRRNSVEQCILWYFHTLPEGEKITRKVLNDWLGYTPAEINPLVKEGWISLTDGLYYMHPLIRQSMQTTEEKWIEYWKQNEAFFAQSHREYIIKQLRQQTFFEKADSFQVIRDKLTFADALTRSCLQMDVEDILYIADCARKHSIRTMGVKYYGLAYERIKNELVDSGFLKDFSLSYVPLHSLFSMEDYEAYDSYYLDRAELYWKCSYYYGYMLSYTQNMFASAETLIMQSLYISQRVFPKISSFKLSRSYSHLGYIHSFDPDKVPQALKEFAHAISSTGLDFDHIYSNTPESMHHFAWCIDDYGSFCAMNYDKLLTLQAPEEFSNTIDLAERYLREALSIRKYLAKLAKLTDVSEYSKTIRKHAFHMGSYGKKDEESVELQNIQKQIKNCVDNMDSTEVAWTCVNLARLLGKKNKQSAEAESLLEKAIEMYEIWDERTPKLHYSSMARAYVAYGQILENQPERYDDAMEIYSRALALNAALENDSPGTYTKEIQDIESALETLEKKIDRKISHSFTLHP